MNEMKTEIDQIPTQFENNVAKPRIWICDQTVLKVQFNLQSFWRRSFACSKDMLKHASSSKTWPRIIYLHLPYWNRLPTSSYQQWKNDRQGDFPGRCSFTCKEWAVYRPDMVPLPLTEAVVAPIALHIHFGELHLCRAFMQTRDTATSIVSSSTYRLPSGFFLPFLWLWFFSVGCFSCECVSVSRMTIWTHPSRIHMMTTLIKIILV